MAVVVLGSLNMDLVVRSPHLPVPGETILGTQFDPLSGGKGANQAVAAARQQVETWMIGRVGADSFGHELRHALAVDRVNVDYVKVDPDNRTGVAAISVSEQGENHIIVVPGANGQVGDPEVEALRPLLSQAKLLLMQFEIPISTVIQTAKLAYEANTTVILDPAPVQPFAKEKLLPFVHVLTPNQVEASQLVGFPISTLTEAAKAIRVLQSQGATTILIKLGQQGVLCGTPGDLFHVPAFSVKAVDTVAAGDAFNGGLAVALNENKPLKEAAVWASATAALSVTQAGAQPSLPTRSQVENFLASQTA